MSNNDQQPYPRPDFERPDLNWTSLDGSWNFAFDDEDTGLDNLWHESPFTAGTQNHPTEDEVHKIEVPYVFQTPASKIDNHSTHEILWYERICPDIRTEQERVSGYRLLVRFGAVDYEATVWVDGQYVGAHTGGHTSFDIDISHAVRQSSSGYRLTIRIRDSPSDLTQPRGKQYWKPQSESIFYTPSSGIWQTVWLESVPATRIADSSYGTILQSNDIKTGTLHAKISVLGRHTREQLTVEISAKLGNASINIERQNISKDVNSVTIDLPMRLNQQQLDRLPDDFPRAFDASAWKKIDGDYVALWSPEHPLLYDINIKLLKESGEVIDEVYTTTGMRSLSWNHSDNTFRLNEKPYFQALILDQGYWPETNMTPPSPDALKIDIELSKAMGFNGCRKHQKVEDPIFLYWADRLGYLVWGEMANAYEFSSIYVERFDAEWKDAMKRDINHPCIVTWTPVNESWGYTDLKGNKQQRDHLRSLYYTTRVLDPTRPVNENCGWEHVCTDLTTFHEYADAPALKDICASMEGILRDKGGRCLFVPDTEDDPGCEHKSHAPIICTEFGGVNIAPAKGQTSGDRDWGYTTVSDPEELLKRLEALVMAVVDGGLCCGFVYTQLTDIEQEVNGLYSFDRKPKLNVAKVKAIMNKAKAKYFQLLEEAGRGNAL